MLAMMLSMEAQAYQARHTISPQACEDLLAGIARGESDSFEAFYRATDQMLYAYALSLTRNHHDAQDVMMDTYLKVRACAHLYRPQGKPLAWVFTIARNLIRSRQRMAGREFLFGELPEAELAIPADDRSDDAVVLREAMRVLTEEDRQIVVLHAVSGLKHRELAELLSLPLSTVLSKYTRALAKLKKALLAQPEEVDRHA